MLAVKHLRLFLVTSILEYLGDPSKHQRPGKKIFFNTHPPPLGKLGMKICTVYYLPQKFFVENFIWCQDRRPLTTMSPGLPHLKYSLMSQRLSVLELNFILLYVVIYMILQTKSLLFSIFVFLITFKLNFCTNLFKNLSQKKVIVVMYLNAIIKVGF